MSRLQRWSDWLAIKESNARKRAVKAALSGTGPELPGSSAACPSTTPQAMAVAAKTGVVKKVNLKTESEQKPDYSFDRWIKMAQELGDDTNRLVGHAEEEEKKLDQAKQQKEKEASKPASPEPQSKEEKSTWKKLRSIHKDRLKDKTAKPEQSDDQKDKSE